MIFSDFLTAAQNAAAEDFRDRRLIAFCATIPARIDAKGVADGVTRAVAEWSPGTEQFDDTTIVVLNVAS
jgi:serine phosphatase RsbU (regulator of sigma subunit)